MYYLVFLFMADHVAKNPVVTGMVSAATAIPFVLFGPFAGVLVDRLDRRTLMLGSEVSSGLITAALAVFALINPSPPVWIFGVAAFLMSTVNTVFFPARSASIPRLVPTEEVLEANGLSESTRQVVAVLGIAASLAVMGGLYQFAPNYFFFLGVAANSLTFFGSAWSIRKLPSLRPISEEVVEVRPRVWEEIREGLRAIKNDPIVVLALPISMLTTIGVGGFFVAYLELNRVWYGGNYATLAGIELSFAVPMMLASMWVGRQTVTHPGRWLIWGQLGVGATVGLMAISQPYWMMLLMNALCGLFLPLMMIPMQSYVQLAFPDHLRGRVNSTWLMMSQAMNPIGALATGFAMSRLGIATSLWVMGGIIAGAGLLGLLSRSFMDAQLPSDQAA